MDGIYQILIKEALDPEWSAWFDDMTITRDTAGATILEGPVIDQAALYGLIGRARDLGLTLLAVNRVTGMAHKANDDNKPDG